jgi:hypothetical protein
MIGFGIRIGGYGSRRLPYPVHVHLPSASGKPRPPGTPIRTSGPDLDVDPPKGDEHHLKLGLFMDAWSRLEQILVLTLAGLLQTHHSRSLLVLEAISSRQLIELMKRLALRTLNGPARDELLRLADRMSRLNSKRNTLVHGHWILEAVVYVRRGDAVLACQFLRETTPTDPEIAKMILKPENQKVRIKHCFTLKRIDAATRDALALVKAFADFTTTNFPEDVIYGSAADVGTGGTEHA